MSELVRFGVAMDRALLDAFDRRILARGYENRSEALRDLVRADLTRAAWDTGGIAVATLTSVTTTAARETALLRAEEVPVEVLSSLTVRIARDRHLVVLALRGRGSELSALAGRVASARGVLSCELTAASALDAAPPAGAAP